MIDNAQPERLVAAMEQFDLDGAVAWFSPKARLYFCGMRVASGRPAIRRLLLPWFANLEDFRHRTIALWSAGGVSVVEADVRYRSAGRCPVSIPVTSILRWSGGQIEDCRVNTWRELFPRIHAA